MKESRQAFMAGCYIMLMVVTEALPLLPDDLACSVLSQYRDEMNANMQKIRGGMVQ